MISAINKVKPNVVEITHNHPLHPDFVISSKLDDVFIYSLGSFFQSLSIINTKFQQSACSIPRTQFDEFCHRYPVIHENIDNMLWWQGKTMTSKGTHFKDLSRNALNLLLTNNVCRDAVHDLVHQRIEIDERVCGNLGPYVNSQHYTWMLEDLCNRVLVYNRMKKFELGFQ